MKAAYPNSQKIEIYLWVQRFEVCIGRYHAFLEDENSFDQGGDTTGSFQMANISFHCAAVQQSDLRISLWGSE